MPNLKPTITATAAAMAYRESILKALPINTAEIKLAKESGVRFPGATTNSRHGVTDLFGKCMPVIQEMVKHNMHASLSPWRGYQSRSQHF